MHRSYISKDWIDSYLSNEDELLPHDVATRFIAVLRVKPDEEVAVFDGAGREVIGLVQKAIASPNARLIRRRVRDQAPAIPAIYLVQAALEEPKLSQTIQRGTEFGVDWFIIFSAARSDKFCFGKLEKRLDRLVSIAQDAARQSGRLFVPSIELIARLDDVLVRATSSMSMGVFGDVATNEHLSTLLKKQPLNDAPCYIAVGPEGGFAPEEKAKLVAHGFKGVVWGPHVLRAELACLSAVAMVNSFCGRA